MDNIETLVYKHRSTYNAYTVKLNSRSLTADIYYHNDKLHIDNDNRLTTDIPFGEYALEPHDIAAVLQHDTLPS